VDEPGEREGEGEGPEEEPASSGLAEDLAAALLRGPDAVARAAQRHILEPAWRTVSEGESRWPVVVAVLGAVVLQLTLPDDLAVHPRWLLPALQVLVLAGLVAVNPGHFGGSTSSRVRATSIALIVAMGVANAVSAFRLVRDLIHGGVVEDAGLLLRVGAAIWATNVIVFALCYWEADRGGPGSRAQGADQYPDFLFPQMQAPDLTPKGWEPNFIDYLYTSFTNATAFSPTDVLPLSRWAKLAMMLQSALSLSVVGLVVARAVNILG
jgi:uncharacterized membrane protein